MNQISKKIQRLDKKMTQLEKLRHSTEMGWMDEAERAQPDTVLVRRLQSEARAIDAKMSHLATRIEYLRYWRTVRLVASIESAINEIDTFYGASDNGIVRALYPKLVHLANSEFRQLLNQMNYEFSEMREVAGRYDTWYSWATSQQRDNAIDYYATVALLNRLIHGLEVSVGVDGLKTSWYIRLCEEIPVLQDNNEADFIALCQRIVSDLYNGYGRWVGRFSLQEFCKFKHDLESAIIKHGTFRICTSCLHSLDWVADDDCTRYYEHEIQF